MSGAPYAWRPPPLSTDPSKLKFSPYSGGGGGSSSYWRSYTSQLVRAKNLLQNLSSGKRSWESLSSEEHRLIKSRWGSLSTSQKFQYRQAQARGMVTEKIREPATEAIELAKSKFKGAKEDVKEYTQPTVERVGQRAKDEFSELQDKSVSFVEALEENLKKPVTVGGTVEYLRSPYRGLGSETLGRGWNWKPPQEREVEALERQWMQETRDLPRTSEGYVMIPYGLTPEAAEFKRRVEGAAPYKTPLTPSEYEAGAAKFLEERDGALYFSEEYMQPTERGRDLIALQKQLEERSLILSSPTLAAQERTEGMRTQPLVVGAYKAQDWWGEHITPKVERFTDFSTQVYGVAAKRGTPSIFTGVMAVPKGEPVIPSFQKGLAKGIPDIAVMGAETAYAGEYIARHPKESALVAVPVAVYMGKGMAKEAVEHPAEFAGRTAAMMAVTGGVGYAWGRLPARPGMTSFELPSGYRGLSAGIRTQKAAWTGYEPLITVYKPKGFKLPSIGRYPDVNLAQIVGKTAAYQPATAFESSILARALRSEGVKITEGRAVRYYTVRSGVKAREITPEVQAVLARHGISELPATEAVINVLRRNEADLYGSLVQEASARSVGVRGIARTPRDFDVMVRDTSRFTTEMIDAVNKRVGSTVLIEKEGSIVSTLTGTKVFDIHAKAIESYLPKGEGTIGYGLRPERLVKTREGVKVTTLSEQASRKLQGALGRVTMGEEIMAAPSMTVKGHLLPTHVGRVKDVMDYYFAERAGIVGLSRKGRVVSAQKAEYHLERWLESWGPDVAQTVRAKYQATAPKAYIYSFEEGLPRGIYGGDFYNISSYGAFAPSPAIYGIKPIPSDLSTSSASLSFPSKSSMRMIEDSIPSIYSIHSMGTRSLTTSTSPKRIMSEDRGYIAPTTSGFDAQSQISKTAKKATTPIIHSIAPPSLSFIASPTTSSILSSIPSPSPIIPSSSYIPSTISDIPSSVISIPSIALPSPKILPYPDEEEKPKRRKKRLYRDIEVFPERHWIATLPELMGWDVSASVKVKSRRPREFEAIPPDLLFANDSPIRTTRGNTKQGKRKNVGDVDVYEVKIPKV